MIIKILIIVALGLLARCAVYVWYKRKKDNYPVRNPIKQHKISRARTHLVGHSPDYGIIGGCGGAGNYSNAPTGFTSDECAELRKEFSEITKMAGNTLEYPLYEK